MLILRFYWLISKKWVIHFWPFSHMGHSTRLGTICGGVNCYIRKCTIYYPWLWLLINIVVISYWWWRDWFHSNLKNNCECALTMKDNRWYIYGCNNWHRHKSCPNLVEWPIYQPAIVHFILHLNPVQKPVGPSSWVVVSDLQFLHAPKVSCFHLKNILLLEIMFWKRMFRKERKNRERLSILVGHHPMESRGRAV